MRVLKWSLAMALAAGITVPNVSRAQTQAGVCDADASTTPTAYQCSRQKEATASVGNLLKLTLSANTISLKPAAANDSTLFDSTFVANNNAEVASGTAVAVPSKLMHADNADTLYVMSNRPFELTVQASTDIFDFAADASYGRCRTSGGTACSTNIVAGLGGKPVKDVYFKATPVTDPNSLLTTQATPIQLPGLSDTPFKLADATAGGGRVTTALDFSSAWFYATDIPGTYSVTMVYTLTGK